VGYGLNVACGLMAIAALVTFLAILRVACHAADLKAGTILNLHVAPLMLSAGIVGIGAGTNYFFAGAPSIVVIAAGTSAVGATILSLLYFKPRWVLGRWAPDAVHRIRTIAGIRLQRRPL
jgi:hypothetical protein